MNSFNLLFSDKLYTDVGLRWSVTYHRCALGFVLTGIIGLLVGAITGHLSP